MKGRLSEGYGGRGWKESTGGEEVGQTGHEEIPGEARQEMIFKCFVALMMASSYSLHLGHLLRTAGPKEKTSHSPIRGLTHLLIP